MTNLSLIKTMPNEVAFNSFLELPRKLYGEGYKEANFNSGNPYLMACYVLLDGEDAIGRFAIYKNPELKYEDNDALCIGSYECLEDVAVAECLLHHAKEICKQEGYQYVIGPMNGSTWDNYRFNLNYQDPFFMDLNQHVYYNEQFVKTGFTKISEYKSNVVNELNYNMGQLHKFEAHYINKGAIFRHLDMHNVDVELYRIAEFCNKAFANNFLFTEIDPMYFVDKYLKVARMFDPELIWIVENQQGVIQSLLFAIPDWYDQTGKTLVLKTMASLPNSEFKGVSTYLARKTHQLARAKGYDKIIHAFFIKENLSDNASQKMASSFHKEYALYGMELSLN